MSLSDKTIAIYYHMPFIIKNDHVLSNPVVGTFIESLVPYFKKVFVFGFECAIHHDRITYRLPENNKIVFVSLGPEGHFWDHFAKIRRLKTRLKPYINKIEILLLRVPSHFGYLVWKFMGKPVKTSLLFIGNPYFTPAYSNSHSYMYFFRKFRSDLHDLRMKRICKKSSTIVFVNSQSLVDVWRIKLETQVRLIHTTSISKKDIFPTMENKKFLKSPYRLLFVGRICNDKGIRELFEALKELNHENEERYILDILGPPGDLGGYSLNQLAKKYDVQDDLLHHGVIPFGEKLFEFYRAADAYILPSYHEGMPHAIWEAMSQGTPVISTPVGGVGDFLIDGEDALFIKIRDCESIAKAVKKLESSEFLRTTLIENGLKKVTNITRESQAKKIIIFMKKQWGSQI